MSCRSHPKQPRSYGFRCRIACVPLSVMLLLLQLAGCGRTTTAVTPPGATPSPTLAAPAVIPGPPLVWQTLPALPGPIAILSSIARGDGDDAYGCVAPDPAAVVARTYVTHDHGMTWARAGDLPVGANPVPPSDGGKGFALECLLVVDATTPAMAVARTVWATLGSYVDPSRITTYATVDFGAHWRALPATTALIFQLASRQGRIYAVRQSGDANASHALAHSLWTSSDQMTTWQAADDGIAGQVQAFWLDPATGALLAQATNAAGTASDQFYTSGDGSAQWAQLAAPRLDPHSEQWVVSAPSAESQAGFQASQPWRICGAMYAGSNTLTCSVDGGQTWVARPALNSMAPSPKTAGSSELVDVFAIAGDGAVLATAIGPEPRHVYRLPVGAGVWQDLGVISAQEDPRGAGLPVYFPTPSGGILWLSTEQGAQVAAYPTGQ